jgi:hypothetical protein
MKSNTTQRFTLDIVLLPDTSSSLLLSGFFVFKNSSKQTIIPISI